MSSGEPEIPILGEPKLRGESEIPILGEPEIPKRGPLLPDYAYEFQTGPGPFLPQWLRIVATPYYGWNDGVTSKSLHPFAQKMKELVGGQAGKNFLDCSGTPIDALVIKSVLPKCSVSTILSGDRMSEFVSYNVAAAANVAKIHVDTFIGSATDAIKSGVYNIVFIDAGMTPELTTELVFKFGVGCVIIRSRQPPSADADVTYFDDMGMANYVYMITNPEKSSRCVDMSTWRDRVADKLAKLCAKGEKRLAKSGAKSGHGVDVLNDMFNAFEV